MTIASADNNERHHSSSASCARGFALQHTHTLARAPTLACTTLDSQISTNLLNGGNYVCNNSCQATRSHTHTRLRLVYWLLLEQSAACCCSLDYLPGSITKFIAGMLRWCVFVSKWDGNVHKTERHLKSKCVRLLTIHRSANAITQRRCQQ